MKLNLPEPEYYSLEILARRWDCPIDEILHYGRTGQLKMSVISEGWYIEEYHYELLSDDEYGQVPDDYRRSYNEALLIHPSSIRKIITNTETSHPLFINEKNGNNISIFNDRGMISQEFYNPDKDTHQIVLKRQHLVITKEHLDQFEKTTSHKESPPVHTGDPGRPSPAHLYMYELQERIRKNHLETSLAEQARVLQAWLKDKYKGLPVPSLTTIENRIRTDYKKAKAAPK